ncbi:hypothetical protein KKA14_01180 [bacterium]|nr:hypothetical protein [bacterium]
MITKLDIWLSLPTRETVKAGEMVVKEPDIRGALKGQFRYAMEYLKSPHAFPLDPLHLPLEMDSFDADRPYSGVHGVFADALSADGI